MNNNKINILTPIPFWHPGTNELIDGLKSNGYTVNSLDIWSFNYFDNSGQIHNLVPKLFRGKLSRIYKRLYRKRVIKKYIHNGDIVDIQWCGHYYSKYMDTIRSRKVKILATLFGSDLYRNNAENRKIQRKIFDTADSIVMGINMKTEFEKHFKGFSDKILFAQYGSKRLDIINSLLSNYDKSILKEKYGISQSKVVVTVGYNSKPEQQHLLFLNELKKAESSIKEKLYLLIPMTYGSKKGSEYYNKLKQTVSELGIDYYFFENRLSDVELAETKIISDITVNLQTTDALASSIKEAMLAKDVLLVGEWLPYEIYEELGIYFERCDLDSFYNKFIEILKNLDFYIEKCKDNSEKVLKFASWKYIIPQFIKNYNT